MNLTEANESVSTDGELCRCLFSKALRELKIPSISNSMRKKVMVHLKKPSANSEITLVFYKEKRETYKEKGVSMKVLVLERLIEMRLLNLSKA